MKVKVITVIISIFLICTVAHAQNKQLPAWFLKAFNEQKLDEKYIIIKAYKPDFLQADFNGDKLDDIAVQITEKRSGKRGILIMHGGKNNFVVLGAGVQFKNEDYNDTGWVNGWQVYKDKVASETQFDTDGDMVGGKKIKIKYPGIYLYATEGGQPSSGIIIHWDGLKYDTIHQGE